MTRCECGTSNCDNRVFVDPANGNNDDTVDVVVQWTDPSEEGMGRHKERRVTLNPNQVAELIRQLSGKPYKTEY